MIKRSEYTAVELRQFPTLFCVKQRQIFVKLLLSFDDILRNLA